MRLSEAGHSSAGTGQERSISGGALNAVLFNSLGRGVRVLGRLFVFGCVARLFSLAATGEFAYVYAVGALASMATDAGLSQYLVRELPAAGFRNSRLGSQAIVIRLLGFPLAICIGWLFLSLTNSEAGPASLGTLAFAAAVGVGDFLAAFRRAHGRYDLEAFEAGIPALGALVFGITSRMLTDSFTAFQLSIGLSSSLLVVLRLMALLRQQVRTSGAAGDLEHRGLFDTVFKARWFFLSSLVAWGFFEANTIFVKHLADAEAAALFAGAIRSVGLLTQPFLVLAAVFTPSLAHDRAFSPERFHEKVNSLNLLMLSFIPACMTLLMLGGRLLLGSFGEAYLQAEPVLLVLALALSVHLGTWSGIPSVVINRERTIILTSMGALVLNLLLNTVLVPRSGAMGAATALLVSMTAAKAAYIGIYRRHALPLGGRRYALILGLIIIWIYLATMSPGGTRLGILLPGGLVSALVTLNLLLKTKVFGLHPRD